MTDRAAKNTDRELYREPDKGDGSFYSDSIHVTRDGGIGINVGGSVFVKPLREWHRLAALEQKRTGTGALGETPQPSGQCRYGKELPDGNKPCEFCGATPDQECQGKVAEEIQKQAALQSLALDRRR